MKKEKRKESAVLEATLATAQAELSLSWSWATVDQYIIYHIYMICSIDKLCHTFFLCGRPLVTRHCRIQSSEHGHTH